MFLRYLVTRALAFWRSHRRMARLPVLAVLAVLVAAGGGAAWVSAAHDPDVRYAQARDAVLTAGKDAATRLNTLDYRSAERDLDAWRGVATGGLGKQLGQTHDSDVKTAKRAKAQSTATVGDAAVSAIDLHAGTATVIVELHVDLTRSGKRSHHDSQLRLRMKRTGDGWKASALNALGSSA